MTSTTFFIVFIPILAFLLLGINLLLAPHNPYQEKDSAFECGFKSFLEQNRTEFHIAFFVFSILFLLFDLEIVLMYPYGVSGYVNDSIGLVLMLVFFLLLTLGFVFELGKNALTIHSRQTLSYDKEELSTPHAYLSNDPFTGNNFIMYEEVLNLCPIVNVLDNNWFMNFLTIALFFVAVASIAYLSGKSPWSWRVVEPFEIKPLPPLPPQPEPCSHSILHRHQFNGDNDYQAYKNVRCSHGRPVMPSLEYDRGTRCDVCSKCFCSHFNCGCKSNQTIQGSGGFGGPQNPPASHSH